MALQQLPGNKTGYFAKRKATNDGRALGTLTDANHLSNIMRSKGPQPYDKKIIQLYTQTALYSNDFQQMLDNESETFWLDGEDSWKWEHPVAYQQPKIISVPSTTSALTRPGIDSTEFQVVLDKGDYGIHHVITAHKDYAQQFYVVDNPIPHNGGFLYTLRLISKDPQNEYVASRWLKLGTEYECIGSMIGEFTDKLPGLGGFGGTIELHDTLSASYGLEHTITSWADCRQFGGSAKEVEDVMVYAQYAINQTSGKKEFTGSVRWEPYIEFLMRKQMLENRSDRRIWGKGGVINQKGEIVRNTFGLVPRLREGNYLPLNKGDFSFNVLRDIFGDLFYRRESMQNRRVKLYTNEAGMSLFEKAAKDDLKAAGLTIMANDFIKDGLFNFRMNKMYSMETGMVEVAHLQELDLVTNKVDMTASKKSAPKFMVFDISPSGNGTLQNNIRPVRHRGQASMAYGYVDGRRTHTGQYQNVSSANTFPGYKIWMEDREDIFIEDLTRTYLIEEDPQYI